MKRALGLLLTVVAFTGCATLANIGRSPDLRAADTLFSERKYGEASAAYRALLRTNSGNSTAAAARYSLAYTLAYYDNPQRDYGQALVEFEEFLRLYPDHRKAQDAKNWRQVLKTVETLNKSIEQLKKLDKELEKKRKMR